MCLVAACLATGPRCPAVLKHLFDQSREGSIVVAMSVWTAGYQSKRGER
jgi:hypothetical protein